jgi:hypothetical protein
VIKIGLDDDQTRIAVAQRNLIHRSERLGALATVITSNSNKPPGDKEPINRPMVQPPGTNATGQRCRHMNLDDRMIDDRPFGFGEFGREFRHGSKI